MFRSKVKHLFLYVLFTAVYYMSINGYCCYVPVPFTTEYYTSILYPGIVIVRSCRTRQQKNAADNIVCK